MENLNLLLEIIDKEFRGKAQEKNAEACSYLTEDGRKCLIGLFIPDGHESQHYSGSVDDILYDYPDLWEFMPSKNLYKLMRLQLTHDDMNSDLSLSEQKEYLKNKAREILGE